MPQFAIRQTRRAGLTLVELLVVITIVVILLAVIAPLARITNKDRKLREAARQVNSFFAGAQARAMERGRTVVVVIDRGSGTLSDSGGTLSLRSVPPPYVGDTTSSTCKLSINTSASGAYAWTGTVTLDAAPANATYISVGNSIRFNYQGLKYPITGVSGASLSITPPADRPQAPPPISEDQSNQPLKYQIFVSPKSMTVPALSLPNGTAIDFSISGQGKTGAEFAGGLKPAALAFAPSGRVEAIQTSAGVAGLPLATTHFHIGWIDKLGLQNLTDASTFWVSVNPFTGTITTTENYYDDSKKASLSTFAAKVDHARTQATSRQSLGGR